MADHRAQFKNEVRSRHQITVANIGPGDRARAGTGTRGAESRHTDDTYSSYRALAANMGTDTPRQRRTDTHAADTARAGEVDALVRRRPGRAPPAARVEAQSSGGSR